MKTKLNVKILVLIISLLFGTSMLNAQNKKIETVKIRTSAVCGQCKDRIEQGLAFEKGIRDVILDLDTKIATVKYASTKTNPDEIRKAISKLGYDADSIPKDKKAYEKLPACCKIDAKRH